MCKKNKLLIGICLIIGFMLLLTQKSNAEEKTITFSDSNFYSKLKEESHIVDNIISYDDSSNSITIDTALVTELSISGEGTITDISGIENFEKLNKLTIINSETINGDNEETDEEEEWYSIGHKISNFDKVYQLKSLKYLSANYCELDDSDIENIQSLANLTSLSLKHNNIKDISPISYINKLSYLYLGDNQITDISAIKNLKELINLEVEKNQISDISVLTNLKKISTLKLNNNQIADFSPVLQLPNVSLTTLSLDSQTITIQAKEGATIKLPEIIEQSFQIYTTTSSIDTINCTVSEDYRTCTLNTGIETARIKISSETLKDSTIIIQIADETTSEYELTSEGTLVNKTNEDEITITKKNAIIVAGTIVVIMLILLIVAVVRIRKNR